MIIPRLLLHYCVFQLQFGFERAFVVAHDFINEMYYMALMEIPKLQT